MATISDLNVRLGLIYKDFDRSLSAVEKKLERSGRKFSQLGNDLAVSISLPLAALGASAIQQAGEIESLKLAMVSTFESAGRSAADANKEVDALRKSALAPGLDFEQAIKGSIRLQGVGASAEDARATIEQIANAIALTGGTAQQLDGVTVQMAQMISKGKVLASDLRVIQENMPIISRLMQQAFGTSNADALQKMGVSGKQFVDKITEAAATLPRVEGGIKNAIVNAGATARQSLAELGDAIIKAFDVTGKLDSFTKSLQGAVDWFKSLSDSTKTTIIEIGLFVAALGPAFKIIGAIQSTRAALVGMFNSLVGGLKSVTAGLLNTAAAYQTLTGAQKVFLGLGIAAAIFVAVKAYEQLYNQVDATKDVLNAVTDVNNRANQSIAKEKTEVDLLIATLNNENSSRDQKAEALAKLQQISPKYFGQLKEENGIVLGLKQSYDKYIQTLLLSAKAAAGREKLVEIERQLLDIEGTRNEKVKDAMRFTADYGVLASAVFGKTGVAGEIDDQINSLNAQKKAIADVIAETDAQTTTNTSAAAGLKIYSAEQQKAADNAEKAANKMAATLKSVENSIAAVNKKQAELGADFIPEKTKEIENGVEKLIEAGFSPNSAPVQKLKGYLKAIRDEIGVGFASSNKAQTAIGASPTAPQALPTLATPSQVFSIDTKRAEQDIKAINKLQSDAIDDIEKKRRAASDAEIERIKREKEERSAAQMAVLGAIVNLANNVTELQKAKGEEEKTRLDKEYANRLAAAQGNAQATAQIQAELAAKKEAIDKKISKRAKAMAIVTAVINTAEGVTKALSSAPPPYNFILAGLTAAAGAIQIATIKSQKFAKGGVITQPTYGLMGEYPGASRGNPEIVTPERLMRSVFRSEIQSGSQNGGVMTAVIRGSDILLSSERAAKERGRYG